MYRLWDDKNKKWLLGYEEIGGFSMLAEIMLFGEYSKAISDIKSWDSLVLEQCIGFNEYHPKGIYVGDITTSNTVIMRNEEKCLFAEYHYDYFLGIWEQASYPIDIQRIKITGNIHEHSLLA